MENDMKNFDSNSLYASYICMVYMVKNGKICDATVNKCAILYKKDENDAFYDVETGKSVPVLPSNIKEKDFVPGMYAVRPRPCFKKRNGIVAKFLNSKSVISKENIKNNSEKLFLAAFDNEKDEEQNGKSRRRINR